MLLQTLKDFLLFFGESWWRGARGPFRSGGGGGGEESSGEEAGADGAHGECRGLHLSPSFCGGLVSGDVCAVSKVESGM